jgi:hypothetical protein
VNVKEEASGLACASSLVLFTCCYSLDETHKRRDLNAIAFADRINDQDFAPLQDAMITIGREMTGSRNG